MKAPAPTSSRGSRTRTTIPSPLTRPPPPACWLPSLRRALIRGAVAKVPAEDYVQDWLNVYASERLTALGLERDQRWIIST